MTSDDSPDRPNDGVMSVESNELTHALQPTSARRVVRGIFLLLGVGVLVPWNAFISAKSYFDSRICSDEGSASGSSINIESTFSMVYNLASVISLALIIAIQALRDQLLVPESHAPVVASTDIYSSIGVLENDPLNETISVAEQSGSSNESHSFWLVMIPLSFYVAAFVVQTCMVFVAHIPFFLQWTILSLAVCGMACGIAQAGIVATAGAYQADLAMNPYLAVSHALLISM